MNLKIPICILTFIIKLKKDGTIEHLVACNVGTVAEWPVGGVSGHMGSHIQLGTRHNDNWSGLPEGMKGIWKVRNSSWHNIES